MVRKLLKSQSETVLPPDLPGYIDNHIKPNIGKISLENLTSLELQKLYKKLLTNGRIDRVESKHQAKGLSPKTSRNIHQIIASAMKLAKEQRLIATDPTEGCALPKLEHKEMQALPVEQLASFLREAKDSGVFEMYYIELATGLRRGELLGLKQLCTKPSGSVIPPIKDATILQGRIA